MRKTVIRYPDGPDDEMGVGGRRFLLYGVENYAAEARAFAEERGGRVPVVETEEVNAALMELLRRNGVRMAWLDGSDEGEEGVWRWAGGRVFWRGGEEGTPEEGGFARWRGGEPNDVGEEDCLVMVGEDGGWNDASCGREKASLVVEVVGSEGARSEGGVLGQDSGLNEEL
eukprot:TRINITY_DN1154_c0_g1_i1.p2 TRINITY_DN1154_c0_g1~~TRINITY_DN1154_c0_g1_i1.p2  ORF type:complete len:171 (+),score=26.93 TRINITY_DN1154_c0_g1_i1:322-834(+)